MQTDIKLEINYTNYTNDKHTIMEQKTFDVNDVNFIGEEELIEIEGTAPFYRGQIELLSTDKNLIELLDTYDKINELVSMLRDHKCYCNSYIGIKENARLDCFPYAVQLDDEKTSIKINCKYTTPYVNEVCEDGDLDKKTFKKLLKYIKRKY